MNNKIKITNLTGVEILLIVHQLLLGIMFEGRGIFWFVNQHSVLSDSPLYVTLHSVMPIWLWGLFIMITGFFIIVSALYVPFLNINNKFYTYSFIGTTSSMIFYFIMLSASLDNNINWLTPFNFLVQTTWAFLISFISGWKLYERRK